MVEDVTVTFGGLTALDSVSLSVQPNQIVGVIGPNGAGKTTLFNVVCGFVSPNQGTLSYKGKAMSRFRPHDLVRLGIARTLQGVGLWPGLTLLENVMAGGEATSKVNAASALLGLGRSSRSEQRLRDRAMALLEKLGVAEHAHRYPPELPYAIQKRTSVARALMEEPSLLLLDEPASGLSANEMADLRQLILELRSNMAVLLVEHHMDLVMSTCEYLFVLNFGRLICSGTPDEVRRDPEVTKAYLGEEVPSGA